jgi:hypothetical protein
VKLEEDIGHIVLSQSLLKLEPRRQNWLESLGAFFPFFETSLHLNAQLTGLLTFPYK